MMTDEIEKIEKMETREDDVWICTFPRSGTTMTQEMVYLVQTLDFDTAKAVHFQERSPIVDIKDDRYPYYKGLKYIEQMESPRLIRTHLHYFLLPEQLKKGKGRTISVVRHPKDVVISLFRIMQWCDLLAEDETTFDSFLDTIVNGTGYACPWPRHVLEYWERRDEKNVLFVRYEDVIKDKPAAIRRIAEFFGRKLTEEDIQRITEHCQVENMRENPMVNFDYFRDIKTVNDHAKGRFINTGRSGNWKDILTTEQSRKVDRLIQELDGYTKETPRRPKMVAFRDYVDAEYILQQAQITRYGIDREYPKELASARTKLFWTVSAKKGRCMTIMQNLPTQQRLSLEVGSQP